MSWLDGVVEFFSDAASGAGEFLGEIGTTALDFAESVGLTSWNDKFEADWLKATTEFAKPIAENSPGLLDRAGDWIGKNKNLTQLVVGGIGAYANNEAKKDAFETQAQGRLNELREQERINKENAERFSASVSGLRKPGLIDSQQKLRRVGGREVFDGRGRMN